MGYWFLVVGYWHLAACFWPLAAHFCICAKRFTLGIKMQNWRTTEDACEHDKCALKHRPRRRPRIRTRELKSPDISDPQCATLNIKKLIGTS